MNFNNNKSIYLQIFDNIVEDILKNKLTPGNRIPSVREMAAEIEVNPNTVMRTYNMLQDNDIIFTKRGMGYFVNDTAIDKCLEIKKREFEENELPALFKTMQLLKINPKDLEKKFSDWQKRSNN